MLKKSWLLIFLSLALVLGGIGIVKLVLGRGTWVCEKGEWVKEGRPFGVKPSTPCLAGGKGVSSENLPNIIISSPKAYSLVGLPLVVTGKARVFENTFNFRLLDDDGTTLVEGVASSNSKKAGEYGDFTINASYPKPKGDAGTIEVFDYSAKDGSVIDKVSLPIKFEDVGSEGRSEDILQP